MDDSLVALIVDLELAVPSYCGLQLTITQHGFPVVLTAFAEFEGTVATSLRLPLSPRPLPGRLRCDFLARAIRRAHGIRLLLSPGVFV
jgi:hypothetical protein